MYSRVAEVHACRGQSVEIPHCRSSAYGDNLQRVHTATVQLVVVIQGADGSSLSTTSKTTCKRLYRSVLLLVAVLMLLPLLLRSSVPGVVGEVQTQSETVCSECTSGSRRVFKSEQVQHQECRPRMHRGQYCRGS